MRCACDSTVELHGNAAEAYVREHLVEEAVDAVHCIVRYRCPDTGQLWILDAPHSELHGGGPPRLRRSSDSGSR